MAFALVVLRPEGVERWAKAHGRDPAALAKTAHDDAELRKVRTVDDVATLLHQMLQTRG